MAKISGGGGSTPGSTGKPAGASGGPDVCQTPSQTATSTNVSQTPGKAATSPDVCQTPQASQAANPSSSAASPEEMAAYYADHPQPPAEPDPNSPTYAQDLEAYNQAYSDFEAACDAFDAAMGPPPTPAPPPAPPTPGAGMPAARIGDMCAHGGAIVGPGCPTVLIGMMPAVRGMPAMDQAACPMFNGPVPHATGTILKGSLTVMIGFMPAARVGDPIGPPTVCAGNAVAMGHPTTLIGG